MSIPTNPRRFLSIFWMLAAFSTSAWGQKELALPPWQTLSIDRYEAQQAALAPYRYDDSLFCHVQTQRKATSAAQLRQAGLRPQLYLGRGRYAVRFAQSLTRAQLEAAGVQALLLPNAAAKVQAELQAWATVPERSRVGTDRVWITAEVLGPHRFADLKTAVLRRGGQLHGKVEGSSFQEVELPYASLAAFAAEPFVVSVSVRAPEDETTNFDGVIAHRANVLQSRLPGGRGLDGRGVMVGVGDEGFIPEHADLRPRMQNLFAGLNGDHADHVAGTVGGAGILNPDRAGMAPKVSMIHDRFSNIVNNAVSYRSTYGMVLTNNSYGFGIACPTTGTYSSYTSTSSSLDEQISGNLPIIHCFAASNDGGLASCGSRTGGFGTISLGYGGTKNTVVVGSVTSSDVISGFSSRGPVADGRVKPDVMAVGSSVPSTVRTNTYSFKSGTSMATPGTTGSLALMYQRYRQLNSNQNPDGALLKALLMNTADDIGNAEVDYRHGYGRININRAVQALEAGRFITGTLSQGGSVTHTLPVAAGGSQLKVMLYWHDYRGFTSGPQSFKALVNDLDMTVTTPSATVLRPWVLNPAVGQENALAIRQIDTLNNVEQVTLASPANGDYTVTISGTEVPFGPQRYYLVWEPLPTGVTLTYPLGREVVPNSSTQRIRWEAPGFTAGTFTVALSTDGGTNYTNLITGLSGTTRWWDWAVPAGQAFTDQARIRVSYSGPEGSGFSNSPGNFVIFGTPIVSIANCDGSGLLTWPAVSGASSYRILQYNGVDSLVQVATTTNLSYPIGGTGGNPWLWVSVQAVTSGGVNSRRSNAIQPATTNVACPWSPDMGVRLFVGTTRGRSGTSQSLSATYQVQVQVKNYGNNTINAVDVPVRYRVGNGPVRTLLYTGTLAPNTNSATLAFSATENFSAGGTYQVTAWTELPGDFLPANDTLRQTLQNIPNPAVALPYTLPLAGLPGSATVNTFGLTGYELADYTESDANGRMRTKLYGWGGNFNTFTLDRASAGGASTTANYLDFTANLSAHPAGAPLSLDFEFFHHGETASTNDRVWARGSDGQPWVELYNWNTVMGTAGGIRVVTGVNVAGPLQAAGQALTSSFQLRFGQEGNDQATGVTTLQGITVGNMRLYNPGADVRLVAITSPAAGCLASGSRTVTISVQNLSPSALTNVPVFYSYNGQTAVAGSIPTLGVGATVSYSFPTALNIPATPQAHRLRTWTAQGGDLNALNDTATAVYNSVVTSFPWHDGFEGTATLWQSGGTNNSWAWGTPLRPSQGLLTDTAANGNQVWATNLRGNYNNNERSYIESPCLNLSGAGFSAGNLPQISFHNIFNIEPGWDSLRLEYSTDGITWTKLTGSGAGFVNWYPRLGRHFAGSQSTWRASSARLPAAAISANTRIRFTFFSDASDLFDGIYLDDIVVDRASNIHNTAGATNGITRTSTGSGTWLHFTNGAGDRIASVQDVANMGTITLDVNVHTGALRTFESKVYGSRNWVLNAQTPPTAPVPVLLYVTQAELDALAVAEPVAARNFQRMLVSRYSGTMEDFSLGNNIYGAPYNTLLQVPAKRPFADGYALEVSTPGFSEYRFGPFPIIGTEPLPARLLSFTGKASPNADAHLAWTTTEEQDLLPYRLERSPDGRTWQPIYTQPAQNATGTHRYSFTDEGALALRGQYYRLRMASSSGKQELSPIVYLTSATAGTVPIALYPNPATHTLTVEAPTAYTAQVLDLAGRVLLAQAGQGKSQLAVGSLPAGAYQIRLLLDGGLVRNLRWQKQ